MIMMTLGEIFPPLLAFSGGLVLGAVFHLGLWWTVVQGLGARRSALWFPASLMLRVGGAVAGFYLLGAGRPARLLACLAGFVVAQILVMRFAPHAAAPAARSIDHAS
jgi:F1F0 ATPase subunit 2